MIYGGAPAGSRLLLVIPHGTGIGDLVNLRPVLAAIAAHYCDWQIHAAVPTSLAWLLPEGVSCAVPTRILRPWQRLAFDHPATDLLGKLSVTATAGLFPLPLLRAAATGFSTYLRLPHWHRKRNDRVLSLLETFLALDLDRRWTAGPWSTDRVHLIDLLAEALAAGGIQLPVEARRPKLMVDALRPTPDPVVILAPNAGSTLKELPNAVWGSVTSELTARGIRPFVLAAPGRDSATIIARQAPAVRILEQSDLRVVTALLAGADVVVAPDTGVLHLAAAVGTRYVGLFGSTDARFLGPYDRSRGMILSTTIEHRPVCRHCWTAQLLPSARCPVLESGNCLSGIAADRIVTGIFEQLSLTARTAP